MLILSLQKRLQNKRQRSFIPVTCLKCLGKQLQHKNLRKLLAWKKYSFQTVVQNPMRAQSKLPVNLATCKALPIQKSLLQSTLSMGVPWQLYRQQATKKSKKALVHWLKVLFVFHSVTLKLLKKLQFTIQTSSQSLSSQFRAKVGSTLLLKALAIWKRFVKSVINTTG